MADFYSRDHDKNERRWLALGYGGKTADPKNWRYWSLERGQGPWLIVAPREFAQYRLVGKKPCSLYYEGEVIFKGSQWAAQWHALSHFYSAVVPTLDIPLSEKKAPSPLLAEGLAVQTEEKVCRDVRVDANPATPIKFDGERRRLVPLGAIGEHPWIGREFEQQLRRILVLGESYYGRYEEPELEHDSVWVSRVLEGQLDDLFFELVPKRLGFVFPDFWHGVMFTNLVMEPLAPDNTQRPTIAQLRAGEPRLAALVKKHKIEGIFSVGKTQAPNAERVARQACIAFAATNHPTGANNRMAMARRFTEANAREAWADLQAQLHR